MDIAIVSYLRSKLDLHISPTGIPARKRESLEHAKAKLSKAFELLLWLIKVALCSHHCQTTLKQPRQRVGTTHGSEQPQNRNGDLSS
jgi:exonuclease VII small subunit